MPKRKTKDFIKEGLIPYGMAVGGGFASDFITNKLEEMPAMANNKKLIPYISTALGLAGVLFAPDNLKPVFYGWGGVSGAEAIGTAMNPSMGYIPGIEQSLQLYDATAGLPPMQGVIR